MYGESRNFINKFFHSKSNLRALSLENTQIDSTQVAEMLRTSDLSNLYYFQINNANMKDDLCQKIWTITLNYVFAIKLKGNEITSAGLKTMQNIRFDNLNLLDLSYNNIDDVGITYLVKNSFPQLQVIRLMGNKLSKKGMQLLSNLDAPKLVQIDLSNNDLTFEDLK